MADMTERDFAGTGRRPRRAYISRTMARHPIAWRATIAGALTIIVLAAAYISFSKWAIAHDSLDFIDQARGRAIDVDLAVRFDVRMRAHAGMGKMPVAVLSHGNTVKYTEYSFIANLLAARGYMVVSIQHDLPTDAELVTHKGELFVGRLKVYERGASNIIYTLNELEKIEPNADYDNLTLVGHSNGGDISMYFAQQHPDMVRKVITLDNLRVPFITSGPKIFSIRSRDWKPDEGVIPSDEVVKKAGIEILRSDIQHTDMSDRGSDTVKQTIQSSLDKFLKEADSSDLTSDKKKDMMSDIRAMGP